MSKSLHNFTTIRQLLDAPNAPEPMAIRLFVLQAHYRQPIDFTDEAIASAQNGWHTLREGLLFGFKAGKQLGWADTEDSSFGNPEFMRIPEDSPAVHQFQEAMDDDINTPGALAVLFELAKELQKEHNRLTHDGKTLADAHTLRYRWQTLVVLAQILGLEVGSSHIGDTVSATATTAASVEISISEAEIEALIQQRQAARAAKNWAESDRIRDDLKAQGITLIDKPGETKWIRES